jgi:hypothetical protein
VGGFLLGVLVRTPLHRRSHFIFVSLFVIASSISSSSLG